MAADPDALREFRESYSVTYRDVVRLVASGSPLVCVVEGHDAAYYRPRIEQWRVLKQVDKVLEFVNARGCDNVLRVRQAVKSNVSISDAFCAYFIDKDFNNLISEFDLYQTDGYSIENLYIGELSVRAILSHCIFEDDLTGSRRKVLDICCEKYAKLKVEFFHSAINFNCWVAAQRVNFSRRISLSNFNKLRFVELDFDKNSAKLCISKENLNEIGDASVRPSDAQIDKIRTDVAGGWSIEDLRGKQNALFLCKFLTIVSEKISSVGSDIYLDGVNRVQFSHNKFISDFTQFAETPISLLKFLNNLHDEWFGSLGSNT